MESDAVKVESVERRDSACCSARRRRKRLTAAWFSVLTADAALCPFLLAGDVQAEVPQESRQPLSFPQAEQRNGNTVLPPKPTDGSGRRQCGYAAAQPPVPTITDLTLGVSFLLWLERL